MKLFIKHPLLYDKVMTEDAMEYIQQHNYMLLSYMLLNAFHCIFCHYPWYRMCIYTFYTMGNLAQSLNRDLDLYNQ